MKLYPVLDRNVRITQYGTITTERTMGLFATLDQAADYVRDQIVGWNDTGAPLNERPALLMGDPVEVHGVRLE